MADRAPTRWWWALVIWVPLAYNPISRWQYEPDKAALTLAITGGLLGRSLWRGVVPRGRRSLLDGLLIVYLGGRWLTLTRSPAPHWSLWGDPAWRNGLWLTLAGVVLFLLARGQLRTPRARRELVDALLIGSAVVAGYGVFQYAGLDPLHDEPWVRVPSTLAHPNLLAAYLAMVMPLTAARVLTARYLRRRLTVMALLAIQALCLVFTYSRAGWLAAATGLSVLVLAGLWMQGHRRLVSLLLLSLLLGFLILLGLSLMPPLPGTAPHILQTLTSLFRWQGATAQIRLLGWQACLEAIAQHPWLGYGPATFRMVLPWSLPPELAPFGGAGALGGRPHNVYLEVAVESGLLGLAAFVALLGGVLGPLGMSVLRAPNGKDEGGMRSPGASGHGMKDEEGIYGAAVLGALAANLVTYLFSFECVATGVLFWVLAGMGQNLKDEGRKILDAPIQGGRRKDDFTEERLSHHQGHQGHEGFLDGNEMILHYYGIILNNFMAIFNFLSVRCVLCGFFRGVKYERGGSWAGKRRPVLGVLVAAGSLILAAWMVVPDVLAYTGEVLAQEGAGRPGLALLAWAGRLGPTPERFWAVEGNACVHWAAAWDDPAIWERGARLHARLVATQPQVAEYHQSQGIYLRHWYRAHPRPERGRLALSAYSEALRLSPSDPDLWIDRGLLWLDLEEPGKALADFEEADSLLTGYTRYYGAMSLHAVAVGDLDGADVWQKKALDAQRAWDAWAWRR